MLRCYISCTILKPRNKNTHTHEHTHHTHHTQTHIHITPTHTHTPYTHHTHTHTTHTHTHTTHTHTPHIHTHHTYTHTHTTHTHTDPSTLHTSTRLKTHIQLFKISRRNIRKSISSWSFQFTKCSWLLIWRFRLWAKPHKTKSQGVRSGLSGSSTPNPLTNIMIVRPRGKRKLVLHEVRNCSNMAFRLQATAI